ncbi:uncharacterized protein J8A68_004591 [[Candida] subhashii]|uniref:Alpha-1,2-mannosyltransferase n=1 Tax=[Candida] subhashii TaxID=561895 RepID=A0A8J5QAW1_9ASCO|nr:uncharacterized protein J8A68_004591 [[Candida] subhashii]KAG7661896.1 hypothetical protein J8A68_004591 [[Candida] subhashii]
MLILGPPSHQFQYDNDRDLPITVDSEQLFQEMQLQTLKHDEVDVEMEQISGSILMNNDKSISHKYWNRIFNILDENRLQLTADITKAIQYVEKEDQLKGAVDTKEVLLSKATISDSVFRELKEKHRRMVEDLPSKLAESTYRKNSKGIVLIGGGKFSWLSYLSIISLRETGSKLAVEIIMPTKRDYKREIDFCNKILPPLQAKCVVLPDVLGETVMKERSFSSFQFKSLALAISSFEHILMLDSDSLPVSNPDSIFDSKLYKYYGMITWPDYWKRTVSPKFYELADIEINESKRVRYGRFPLFSPTNEDSNINNEEDKKSIPYHDLQGTIADMSTESGQLVINKRTHGKTILMSLFYNIYGPNLFYKLLALGEQGEGEKDTYVAAAMVTKQTYYQVKSSILTFGYFDEEREYHGVAMGQKNPVIDYELFQELVVKPIMKDSGGYNEGDEKEEESTIKMKSLDEQIKTLETLSNEKFHNNNENPLFTIHCNYPKLDPLQYMERSDLYDESQKRLKHRVYGDIKYPKYIKKDDRQKLAMIDFEFEQWNHMNNILCVEQLSFSYFEKTDMNELCQFIDNQVKWLSE